LDDNLETLSWVIAYLNQTTDLQTCLDDYDYFGLTYDESLSYTKIALADCVYQHYSDYLTEVEATVADVEEEVGGYCLEVYGDDYVDTYCVDEEEFDEESTCGFYCYNDFDGDSYGGRGRMVDPVHYGCNCSVASSTFVTNYDDYCADVADCASGEICSSYLECVGCEDDTDCDLGYECDTFVCVEETCSSDSDCSDGYACDTTNGVCYTSCSSHDECNASAACVLDGTNYLNECVVCEDSDENGVYELGTASGSFLNGNKYFSNRHFVFS